MTIRIALDAMGGDHAPRETVHGAVLAAREYDIEVVLVGRQPELHTELARHPDTRLSVVHAEQVVDMHEHASDVVRAKKDSSIAVGLGMVARQEAQAFVSAGNSGAVMAFSLFTLGRIKGIERPALGLVFGTPKGPCLLLDVGANVDCKPQYLLQFARMGSTYVEKVYGKPSPRVGLISTGEEETKGNQLVQEAHRLLKEDHVNFIGNIEGRDLPAGMADVAVCDGFTGNVVLKLSEGLGSLLVSTIRRELTSNLLYRLAGLVLLPALRRSMKSFDYTEYGGVPLLGLNGVCIIAHGRSNALAIKNAIRVARLAAEQHIIQAISEWV
jgi:glycerol-3-phosphate acyltransferase PlsX